MTEACAIGQPPQRPLGGGADRAVHSRPGDRRDAGGSPRVGLLGSGARNA